MKHYSILAYLLCCLFITAITFIGCEKDIPNNLQSDHSLYSNYSISKEEEQLLHIIKNDLKNIVNNNRNVQLYTNKLPGDIVDPTNDRNPLDFYGRNTHRAFMFANSKQVNLNVSLDSASKKYKNDGIEFFKTGIIPSLNLIIQANAFELTLIQIYTEFFSIENIIELNTFILVSKSIETNIATTAILPVFRKNRLLATFSTIKYTAVFFGINDFILNGKNLNTTAGPGWEARWNKCMKDAFASQFQTWTGWAGFLLDFGVGPGGSVLAQAVECAIKASL